MSSSSTARTRPTGLSTALRRPWLGLLAAAGIGLGQPALALTDEEVFRSFRAGTPAPGARALGMGGAFIGLADDATATFTNPAGLGYMSRPQAAFEMRLTDGDPVGYGVNGAFGLSGAEKFASGAIQIEEQDVASPSFLAYVHPINDYLVVGFSRHERLNQERDSFTSYLAPASSFGPIEDTAGSTLLEPTASLGHLDVMVDTFSVSVASAPIEQLSLGITLSIARADVLSTVDTFTYRLLDEDGNGAVDTFARPLDFRTHVDDSDTVVTFSAGLLYRPSPKFGIGLVYRDGPEFDLVESVKQDGLRSTDLRKYLFDRGIAGSTGEFINTLALPDSYGLGLAFGPFFDSKGAGGLTITADVVHHEYTDLLTNFVKGLNSQLFAAASDAAVLAIDDETQAHVGLAWTWTVGFDNSIHLRAGAYTEPDSSIESAGRPSTAVAPGSGQAVAVGQWVGTNDDELHVTLGAGFTIKKGAAYSFQVDGAADFSDLGEVYVGTALVRF